MAGKRIDLAGLVCGSFSLVYRARHPRQTVPGRALLGRPRRLLIPGPLRFSVPNLFDSLSLPASVRGSVQHVP